VVLAHEHDHLAFELALHHRSEVVAHREPASRIVTSARPVYSCSSWTAEVEIIA
jgi:hypothetical protein